MKEKFEKIHSHDMPPVWAREIAGDTPKILSVADAERAALVFVEASIATERMEVLHAKLKKQTVPAELLLIGDAQKLNIQKQVESPFKKKGFLWRKENHQEEKFTTESYAVKNGEQYPFQMTYQASGKGKDQKVLPKEYIQMLQPREEFTEGRFPYLRVSFTDDHIHALRLQLTRNEIERLEKKSLLEKLSPDLLLDVSIGLPKDNHPWIEIISAVESAYGGGGRYTLNPSKNQFELKRKFRRNQPPIITVDAYQGLLGEILDFIPHNKEYRTTCLFQLF